MTRIGQSIENALENRLTCQACTNGQNSRGHRWISRPLLWCAAEADDRPVHVTAAKEQKGSSQTSSPTVRETTSYLPDHPPIINPPPYPPLARLPSPLRPPHGCATLRQTPLESLIAWLAYPKRFAGRCDRVTQWYAESRHVKRLDGQRNRTGPRRTSGTGRDQGERGR